MSYFDNKTILITGGTGSFGKKFIEIVLKKYRGKVPKSQKKLEMLPQVGHKTASVVMVFAFKKPGFPIDTHIKRLAKRWGLSSKKDPEKDLKKLFPKKEWGKIHLQMIHFAKKFCKAKDHKNCPICHQFLKIK